jgi:two-component system, chemotaxis family, protein-glutamate methylesterase/glutaminase
MHAFSPSDRRQRSEQNNPIRVMLVDDSRVARTTFGCILESHPEIEVAAEAGDCDEALELLRRSEVDIILLDIEMPKRSGIDALPDIVKAAPSAKIVVVSTFVVKNGPAALKALSLGACDTLAKPGSAGARSGFTRDLIEKVFRLGRSESQKFTTFDGKTNPSDITIVQPNCIAIGASTGGIPVIFDLVKNLNDELNCPVIIVQHLPNAFMDFFARQLASFTERKVSIAGIGEEILDRHIYVAPGDLHLICKKHRGRILFDHLDAPDASPYCPSVDILFTSIGKVYGKTALGIVLSGMGNDGLAGARLFASNGAPVLVQDEESSVVWGMPGAIAREQLATAILSVNDMSRVLARTTVS